MKASEMIWVTVGLLPLPATGVAALLGDESAPVGAGLTFAALALLYLAFMRWNLRKQGVPFWCWAAPTTGRHRPHKFADISDPGQDPRIWECLVCGVRRQVTAPSRET